MKNVDPPPILATLLSKQQTPPHSSEIQRDPPPNWLSFIYTPPKIGEYGLPPIEPIEPMCLDVFDIFPMFKVGMFGLVCFVWSI